MRVRPALRPSDPGYELVPQRFQRSILQVISPTSLAIDSSQGRKLFVFDKVFDEDVQQQGVWEYLNESVNAFMQGYNVSVLAYGQSGSGKSYTMGTSGPAEQSDPQLMGESRFPGSSVPVAIWSRRDGINLAKLGSFQASFLEQLEYCSSTFWALRGSKGILRPACGLRLDTPPVLPRIYPHWPRWGKQGMAATGK